MIKYLFVILVFVGTLFPSQSLAETITIDILGEFGEQNIDLGQNLGQIISVSLAGSIEIFEYEFWCLVKGPSFCGGGHGRYFSEELQVEILSASGLASLSVRDSGQFQSDFILSGEDPNSLFSDGTGTITISSWYDPENIRCQSDDPMCFRYGHMETIGEITLSPVLQLIVVHDENTPILPSTWDTIKSYYR